MRIAGFSEEEACDELRSAFERFSARRYRDLRNELGLAVREAQQEAYELWEQQETEEETQMEDENT